MGSGAGGAYSRTWGAAADRELRERVARLVEEAAGALAGDSAVELAEALMRLAAGADAGEAEFPEPGDAAFDLALDALSAFVPGGAAATRSLGLAARVGAKASKGARKGAEAESREGAGVSRPCLPGHHGGPSQGRGAAEAHIQERPPLGRYAGEPQEAEVASV